ncbi:hypothetical protein [Flintibacter muris]|uniref:hypothetical protein n=1 Tax=Flintibacter muris TaxID=2941327 RepID=UPI00203D0A63|nr:hypothetical protein [Flintibacter muris]
MGEKKKFQLKWPWNWLLYGVAFLIAGRMIGYLWAALILVACGATRKAKSAPEGSYCLDRTRKGLAKLFWALLYLFFGFAGGVCFYMQMQEDRSLWELKDWAFTIFTAVLCLGGTALGLAEAYTDLRDAFCPAKSKLAKSIRSQLPYPDEAPPVEELFAMVDKDIQENGQWFDRVAIGKEWVFGDEVTSIARIRGVFPRDEMVIRHAGGRRQSTRIMELWIVDDRRQIQVTTIHKPAELKAAVDCLRLRMPEAFFDDYKNMSSFTNQTDEEWQATNRSVLRRQDQRLARQEDRERSSAGSNTDFALIDLRGQRTSRFDRRTVEDQLTGLKAPGQHFELEPVELIPIPGLNGVNFSRLSAGITNAGLTLVVTMKMADGTYQAVAKPAGEQEVWQAFASLLERKQLPDFSNLSQWQPLQAMEQPRQRVRARLSISDRTGATRDYDSFTRRDVELAGEGLASGKYTVVALFAGPRYIYLKAGDKLDGRVTVNASRPDPDKLRVFETKCTDRQAQEWLLQMSEGTFDPDFSQWKDVTKKLEKETKK